MRAILVQSLLQLRGSFGEIALSCWVLREIRITEDYGCNPIQPENKKVSGDHF